MGNSDSEKRYVCENCDTKLVYDIEFVGEGLEATATEVEWFECEDCGWMSDVRYGQSWPEAEYVAGLQGSDG